MLVTRRALGLVLDELDRVTSACAGLARSHRDTPMAGRTMLQQAVPTTFGLKAAGWLVTVLDARARLAQLRDGALAAQLGGAVGTLAAMGEHGPEIARLFARELELAEPTLPWHTNRVRVAELGAALQIAAGAVAKIGLDVLLLAQTEIAEVREGGRGGRLHGDAPEAQRGRCHEGPRLRRAHAGARVRAHGCACPGARAGSRGLAGRVGGALRRAPVCGRRGCRTGRVAGGTRGRRGSHAGEPRPHRRADRRRADRDRPHRATRPHGRARARARCLAARGRERAVARRGARRPRNRPDGRGDPRRLSSRRRISARPACWSTGRSRATTPSARTTA